MFAEQSAIKLSKVYMLRGMNETKAIVVYKENDDVILDSDTSVR